MATIESNLPSPFGSSYRQKSRRELGYRSKYDSEKESKNKNGLRKKFSTFLNNMLFNLLKLEDDKRTFRPPKGDPGNYDRYK